MSRELTRRAATESDKPFLWEANRQAYRDVVVRQWGHWDDESQERDFNEKWESADFELVELAGEPVGAIWTTDEGEFLRLREVFLLPEHQGKGIGTQLVKQELARARRESKPLRLRVLRENRARVLYERLGFTVSSDAQETRWMEAV
jgi:GNAT superfamily N-acetyltransferase